MKVILREEVENLGDIGDLVEVADGYGRNFLIPQGLALPASGRKIKGLEHEKRVQAQRLMKAKGAAEEFAARLEKLALRIGKKVGEGDRLYGSVTAQEIAAAVGAAGERVDRRKIQLESPIKSLGDHKVPVKVHPEVTAELNVSVVAEGNGGEPKDAPAETAEAPTGSETQKGADETPSGAETEGEQTKESE